MKPRFPQSRPIERFIALGFAGIVLITFVALVLSPREMDSGTLAIVRFLAASFAGVSAYLFTGTFQLKARIYNVGVKATGSFAAFLAVFLIFFYGIPTERNPSSLILPPTTSPLRVGSNGQITRQPYVKTYDKLGVRFTGSPRTPVESWDQPQGSGTLQNFSGGSEDEGILIMSNNDDEVFWIGGSFWRVFQKADSTKGILVHPTGNRFNTSNGSRQNFKGGAILKSSHGTFDTWGGVGGHYLRTERGEVGRLGFPITREQGIGAGIHIQEFENGSICYDENGIPTRTIMHSNQCR